MAGSNRILPGAARYGAASGEINDVAFYQDCDGIRDVAYESAFIIEFENINITYDRGVDEDGNQIPISGVEPNPDEDTCPIDPGVIRNGDRIIVQVSAIYEPIITAGPIEPIEIVSSSARSFLISVPIVGSALPTGFSPETSTPSQVPASAFTTFTPTFAVSPTYTFIPPSLLTNTPDPNTTPTNTVPPTPTLTPSRTPLPTSTASVTPTAISCNGLTGVSHGPLEFEDNIMTMTIDNQTGHTLMTASIYLEWNHDSGHGEGSDLSLYGPTETTVCTWHELTAPPEGDAPLPIGRACPFDEALVLDEALTPVPAGGVGELWIRGATVMQGYWGRPERTALSLQTIEVAPGLMDRAYRTGDLVRQRADGELEFLGRRDHQVKTRGYRVELGEIETRLAAHASVEEPVVVAVPDDEITNRLKAAVVLAAGAAVTADALKQHCAATLPRYMVPETIEFHAHLPRTSSGKIDRRALTDA